MERLKADVRAKAWLRQAQSQGLMATVARKGEPESGTILLKIGRGPGVWEVFSPVTAPSGAAAWLRAFTAGPVAEREADAYLQRQATYDADLWVVEIEDPKGLLDLGAPVLKE